MVAREDQLERDRTCYVRRGGAAALLSAVVRSSLRGQCVYFGRRPWHGNWAGVPSARSWCILFTWLTPADFEPWLRTAGIQHLHVHFANNSAEIAMLVRTLGGPQWSFTAHGRDIENAPFTRLAAKIRDSFLWWRLVHMDEVSFIAG